MESHRNTRERDTHKEKDRRDNNENKKASPKNVIDYYKSFSKKPSTFKEMYESNDEKYSSSSDNGDSSSEDFPSPKSPRKKPYKRDDDDYGTMFNKMNDMQRRLYHVELKQRKHNANQKTGK